jgi:PadR family transcriptional regulator, regulatory protein AphA
MALGDPAPDTPGLPPSEPAAPALPPSQLPPPELTATGRVILGMIGSGKRTGYDIKQLVDKSTRHFWAASYGQIYPELKRLEDQGLIRGRPEPTGGRPRTVYELTNAGETALAAWLRSGAEPVYELRDEGMLKLFFSDLTEAQQRIENIRSMRERQERKLAQLRALEPLAPGMPTGPALTLQLGIGVSESMIEWCEAAEQRLAGEE